MTRNARTARTAARALTPAAAFRNFATSARNAVEAGLEDTRSLAASRVGEARSKTLEAVTRLEKVFEQRVSRALTRLGVPSTRDVRALSRQVSELQASVERLKRARARARA
jgi:poly(hydroxyalkanoate) granule-associated protein